MPASSIWGCTPGAAAFVLGALILGSGAAPAVGLRDSGELGTAGMVLGVPHPTGFPCDVLLLRAFSLAPIGNLAFRQNLGAALLAALALACLGDTVARLIRMAGGGRSAAWLGAMMAAAGLLTWETFQQSALTAEVYASALWVVLLGLNAVVAGGRRTTVVPLLVGLGLGMHVTVPVYCALLSLLSSIRRPAGTRSRFLLVRAPAVLVCALVVFYLPLASIKDPALDWGDPETAAGFIHHLSAGRIREAFQDRMFAGQDALPLLGQQLLELMWVAPFLVLGAIALRRLPPGVREGVAVCALLATVDLAYGLSINPMGVIDRQVGHVLGAGLCVLAGVGGGVALTRVGTSTCACVVRVAVGATVILGVVSRVPRDRVGYVADELHGAGGTLARLPSRAVLVCWSDSQCGVGLFARHAEGGRPDVTVVPAQHLWDFQYLRQLRDAGIRHPGLPSMSGARAALWLQLTAQLASTTARPVFWESPEPAVRAGVSSRLTSSELVPYFVVAAEPAAPGRTRALLTQALRERGGEAGLAGVDARAAWGRAHRLAGEQALRRGQAGAARPLLLQALSLHPGAARGWIALGVAAARDGDIQGALSATRRALALTPDNATAWTNLVRYTLASGARAEARRLLAVAHTRGVRDARLAALARRVTGEK